MKHKLSITVILLSMFLITQFIGLAVVHAYTPVYETIINPETGVEEQVSVGPQLPFGLQIEEEEEPSFFSIVLSFGIAFAIIFVLMKYRWRFVMRAWFFFVVALAVAVTLNALLKGFWSQASTIALTIAIVLSYLKIYRPGVIIHNVTELAIYPGIGAIFVPLLTPTTMVALLVLISLYDMWAVWRSGIMQQMARFQMEELKVFGGFLLPSASKSVKAKIRKIKEKYKNKKMPKKVKNQKFKINLAILGGGDVVFPIIAAGVFLRSFGLAAALFVTAGSFVGLAFLFAITKKDRAYPAMPYITTGILLGMLAAKLFVL